MIDALFDYGLIKTAFPLGRERTGYEDMQIHSDFAKDLLRFIIQSRSRVEAPAAG